MTLDIDLLITQCLAKKLLPTATLKQVCMLAQELLIKESNVRQVMAPVTLVGDVHGQYYDLLEIFKIGGMPPTTNYIFLGDYVDRGHDSVETITLLTLLKVRYPDRVTLVRGNHESRAVTMTYGFFKEIPHEGPMSDLVWSDPVNSAESDFALSPRGAGYVFGKNVTRKFLETNSLGHICRAHQLCMEGYQVLEINQIFFDDMLSTVWSAPNYCYRAGNLASILEIGPYLDRYFNVFGPSPDQKLDKPKPLKGALRAIFDDDGKKKKLDKQRPLHSLDDDKLDDEAFTGPMSEYFT